MNNKNYRKEKLEEEFKKNISKIIFQLIKNNKYGFLTITKVILSNNFLKADVYISILNSKNKINTLKFLNKLKGKIKKIISNSIKIRYIPDLFFHEDITLEYSIKINKIIKNIKEDKTKNKNEKFN